jgi:NACalpha-BTF3-like transcription factor
MSKKPNKKEAILEYVKNNPKAKNAEVAKACGVHPTYASMIRRNDGVKTPKKSKPAAKPEFVFKQDDFAIVMRQINSLKRENEELRDDIVRMSGVIEYLEAKLQHATSI